jgi:hypothetical protein
LIFFLAHSDNGHTHWINLNTDGNGWHQHGYKDIFHSESHGYHDQAQLPNRFGQGSKNDWDNVGLQMDRETWGNGWHTHHVGGNSNLAYASLKNTGGGKEHENRPPFYVVAYIIYMGV